jgi:hypothetical protein
MIDRESGPLIRDAFISCDTCTVTTGIHATADEAAAVWNCRAHPAKSSDSTGAMASAWFGTPAARSVDAVFPHEKARALLAQPQPANDLHAAIMNLQPPASAFEYQGSPSYNAGFAEGHKQARHAAAELVAAQTQEAQPVGYKDVVECIRQHGPGTRYEISARLNSGYATTKAALQVAQKKGLISLERQSTTEAGLFVLTALATPTQPQEAQKRRLETLPEMPPPVTRHAALGDLYDRLAMHLYAMRIEAALNAAPAQPAQPQEAVGVLQVFDDVDAAFGFSYDILATASQHQRLRELDGCPLYAAPAQPAQPPADGWVRVPREPTEEMLAAAEQAEEVPVSHCRDVYRAMLAAAPQRPAREPLTPEQRTKLLAREDWRSMPLCRLIEAVEQHHGIGGNA